MSKSLESIQSTPWYPDSSCANLKNVFCSDCGTTLSYLSVIVVDDCLRQIMDWWMTSLVHICLYLHLSELGGVDLWSTSLYTEDNVASLGAGLLCQHNFEHNRSLKASSIMGKILKQSL